MILDLNIQTDSTEFGSDRARELEIRKVPKQLDSVVMAFFGMKLKTEDIF
jgi:hypothetical protein